MPKEQDLGTFELGLRNVKLIAIKGTSANFRLCGVGVTIPEIRIGVEHTEWRQCLALLLHEAVELAMVDLEARYSMNCDLSTDSNRLLFVLRHDEFSEAIARASEFVVPASKVLKRYWKKVRR